MNLKEFEMSYLNHYLLLESDFAETIPYVSLAEENFNTYSAVYLKQLLSICSEVDILLSFTARLYEPVCSDDGFGCSKIILKHEPDIKNLQVQIKYNELVLRPWNCTSIPDWWTAYNEIKHNRLARAIKFDGSKQYFQYANLRNVLDSLSALFSLELYAYKKLAELEHKELYIPTIKSMFTIKNSYWEGSNVGSKNVVLNGCLYIDDQG